MELTSDLVLILTKAELLAICEYAGPAADDVRRFVRFVATDEGLTITATDGSRTLDVTWPYPEGRTLNPRDIGVDSVFLAKGAALIRKAGEECLGLDLSQLEASATRGVPARAVVMVDHPERMRFATDATISATDVVTTQTALPIAGVRSLLIPPHEDEVVLRKIQLQPKHLATLNKVATAAGVSSCALYAPTCESMGAVAVFTCRSGAVWSVLLAPAGSGEEVETEMPEAETFKVLDFASPDTGKRVRKGKGRKAS